MENLHKINLSRGWPSPDLLPVAAFQEILARKLDGNLCSFLQYGYEEPYDNFRKSLASFLSENYKLKLNYEQFFVTAGISGAIDMICSLFTKTGDTVFVEDASYFCIFRIFTDHGLNLVKVPTDEQGIIPSELEKLLKIHKPKLLYTIPTHQNPTGNTLSNARRAEIVELSKKHEFYVVADEVYQLLNIEPVDVKPFEYFNKYGMVFSVSAFTKILSPGVRLGWVYSSPALYQRFHDSGMFFSGGNMNHTMAGVLKDVLDSGIQASHLELTIENLRERRDVLVRAIDKYIAPYVEYIVPKGGYFVWLRLKDNRSAEKLLNVAKSFNLEFMVGNRCSIDFSGLDNYFRLCFAYTSLADLEEGVSRLKSVFEAY